MDNPSEHADSLSIHSICGSKPTLKGGWWSAGRRGIISQLQLTGWNFKVA